MTLKSKMRSVVNKQNTPSHAPNAMLNRAGGVSFEIEDPSLKLVTMTAGSFFAEPRYYEGDLTAKRVTSSGGASTSDRFDRLTRRLDLTDRRVNWMDVSGIDDVTKEIFATAVAISESSTPEDLLILARWLRNDMNIRSTPQALLVVASRLDKTKPFVRKYAPTIVVRPDEIKTCMLMHRFFFGMKSIKNCLGQGLSDAMGNFNERSLLKYDSPGWPTWRDVLQILPRGKGRPLSPELAGYFLNGGEVIDADKTPVVAARKALAKMDSFNAQARKLASESFVNWEVLLSQFGNQKTEVWEYLIKENLVGYMALLRNLRNLLEAGVSNDVVNLVVSKLADPNEVERSKQLPFRFLMAHKVLRGYFLGNTSNSRNMSKMLEAIEEASNLSVFNIPVLPGLTAVFADNSGSMSSPVSEKSQMTCAGAANALCGIIAKRAEDAFVAAFATEIAPVTFTKHDTVIGIADRVAYADTRGWDTNAHKIPQFLEREGLKPDRVIILSDMQCWDKFGYGWYGDDIPLCDRWDQFSKKSPKTWMHSVHLDGYGDTPVDEGSRVNQLAGFSEKIVSMLLQTEGCVSEDAVPIPTVQQIRDKWKL